MSGPFSLGTIDVLRVAPNGFQGWDYPKFGTTHRRLDDGTGTSTGNELLQSARSIPNRRTQVSGNFIDRTDLNILRGYNETKEQVDFTDDNGEVVPCVVLEFTATQVWPEYWVFSMELMEVT
jgi:hypothetical protein